jgi:hypothetical protein
VATTFNNSGGQHAGRDINMVGGDMTVREGISDHRPPSWPRSAGRARIFITYRRDDTAGDAGRLYDSLTQRFDSDSVFLDAEAIPPGEQFGRVIRESIEGSGVLLALIGPRWATATDGRGRLRLSDPDDWVRREIQTAADRHLPIVPVLVRGARMPAKEQLPKAIRCLADFQAFSIGDHWQGDVDRLADAIRRLLG